MMRLLKNLFPALAILLSMLPLAAACPPDGRIPGDERALAPGGRGSGASLSAAPGKEAEGEAGKDGQGEELQAGAAVLLGIMGMLGVFAGLVLLSLSLVGLKKAVQALEAVKKAKSGAPPGDRPVEVSQSASLPAQPQQPEKAEPDPQSEHGSPSEPRRLSGWKLAGSAAAGPEAGAWMKPAFRAAFASSAGAGPVKVKVAERDYSVDFVSFEGACARLRVNGRDFEVDLGDLPEDDLSLAEPQARVPAAPARKPAAKPAAPAAGPQKSGAQAAPAGAVAVRAPIPGTVIGIRVGPGSKVAKGQEIILLEAMKMENKILAPVQGTVREITVSEKAAVRQGDVLAVLDPA